MRFPFLLAFALSLLIAGLGVAGGMDHEDEALAAELYCSNVYNGVHPDFDESYSTMCRQGKLRRQ